MTIKTEILTLEGRLVDQDNLLIIVYVMMTIDDNDQLLSYDGAWDRNGVPLTCTDFEENRGINYWTRKEAVDYV